MRKQLTLFPEARENLVDRSATRNFAFSLSFVMSEDRSAHRIRDFPVEAFPCGAYIPFFGTVQTLSTNLYLRYFFCTSVYLYVFLDIDGSITYIVQFMQENNGQK